MKSIAFIIFLWATASTTNAQQVDSICFHLYTDSLKKGTYNYINVDGKFSNDRWLPLTAKEVNFISSGGRFEGNSLFIENDFTDEKITVKAVLKSNPAMFKQTIIYVKKGKDNEYLE